MLKKGCLFVFLASVSLVGHAATPVADPLHIAGDYKCTGYDSHDGHFKGDLNFKLDKEASHFDHGFGAYTFTLRVELEGGVGATYSGMAAAQGNQLAMYFANDSAASPTDRGIGQASITHDQDAAGKYTTTLHKSYYLPAYMRDAKNGQGAGRGTEVCVKTVAAN